VICGGWVFGGGAWGAGDGLATGGVPDATGAAAAA
jgi:hypothetical protein